MTCRKQDVPYLNLFLLAVLVKNMQITHDQNECTVDAKLKTLLFRLYCVMHRFVCKKKISNKIFQLLKFVIFEIFQSNAQTKSK